MRLAVHLEYSEKSLLSYRRTSKYSFSNRRLTKFRIDPIPYYRTNVRVRERKYNISSKGTLKRQVIWDGSDQSPLNSIIKSSIFSIVFSNLRYVQGRYTLYKFSQSRINQILSGKDASIILASHIIFLPTLPPSLSLSLSLSQKQKYTSKKAGKEQR